MKDPNNHEQPPKDPATDQPPALQTTSADEPSNDPEHGGSKRWRPLGILAKVLMVLLLVLVTIIVGVYYAVGTPWGTQLLIKALVKETGIRLKYGEGNLRDGLWVYDLTMPANPPKSYVEVTVDRAYVKVGWRAVLNKEVHLREAKIHNMVINYKKPPNNQPFDYEKISLPVNLTLDDVQANLVRYQQVTKEPLDFKQAHVQNFTWYDSQIKVGAAKLSYNELFSADQLSGNIDLQHDYPLDVTGQVVVHSLSKAYIDALDAHVMGSLKFMTADINSRYNNAAVTGHVTAQPLDDHAPFNAKVVWQEVLLPYATDQNIRSEERRGGKEC